MSARSVAPTVIRVVMGAFFLFEFASQVSAGWLGGDGLAEKISRSLAANDIPGPYTWFLENAVLEWDHFFTLLTLLGELSVGVGLVMGLVTRLSALSAMFMNVNFWLMNGIVTGGAIIDLAFVAGGLVVLLMAPSQSFSIDERLFRLGLRHPLLSGDIAGGQGATA